jgi:hypothetical protein
LTGGDVVAAEGVEPWGRLLRGSGLALVTAAVLLAAATLLHPSYETAATITASEGRLVAATSRTRSAGFWCCWACRDCTRLSVAV